MSYEEQIMSKDKYPSIFSPHMEAITISNEGKWNNCFSKFSNRVLPPIFISRAEVENFVRKTFKLGALGLLAHSRSFTSYGK